MRTTRLLLTACALALPLTGCSPIQVGDPQVYLEDFDQGNGGWYADRHYALPVWDGVAYCHGPWFLDSNHAPPGAGYLHLVMWLYTDGRWYEHPTVSTGRPFLHKRKSDHPEKFEVGTSPERKEISDGHHPEDPT